MNQLLALLIDRFPFRSSITNRVVRIGELAADSAESIGGFAEGFYNAATVIPNGVPAAPSLGKKSMSRNTYKVTRQNGKNLLLPLI